MIKIPLNHIVEVSIEKLIEYADETELNELILLAEKKLNKLAPEPVFKIVNYMELEPRDKIHVLEHTCGFEITAKMEGYFFDAKTAKLLMLKGNKIKYKSFNSGEYIRLEQGIIYDENDIDMGFYEDYLKFKDFDLKKGWSVYES